MNGDKTGKRSDENKTYTGFRNPGSYGCGNKSRASRALDSVIWL